MTATAWSWTDLEARVADYRFDGVHGPTNAHSRLRLFGCSPDQVRVTLYRDHHAWCPYCQKVWLWLEERRIPYRVRKVTMFCYGEKEPWYTDRVPSGMLPALELDGRIITESDAILSALEQAFGPLGPLPLEAPAADAIRQLERGLFRAWCRWLCHPHHDPALEGRSRASFVALARDVEARLADTPGPYLREAFGALDVIFTPYIERMHASLFYYKGFALKTEHPAIGAWLEALEERPAYRGTQGDFHTHVHDLPPQMGGCYSHNHEEVRHNQRRVDEGPWEGLPEVNHTEPATSRQEALNRVLKHRDVLLAVNPAPEDVMDAALRGALTRLVTGADVQPPAGGARGLRYLRDRISVPRDMSLYAARRLREALEHTAALAGGEPGPPLPTRHRRDQDPAPFRARRPSG
ncbi:MAG: glutathione S-transferase family protein [Myxococcota bacterium]